MIWTDGLKDAIYPLGGFAGNGIAFLFFRCASEVTDHLKPVISVAAWCALRKLKPHDLL